MKRRDTLKTLLAGSLASGIVGAAGCKNEGNEGQKNGSDNGKNLIGKGYGRTPEEVKADAEIYRKGNFFTAAETAKIAVLADIIIPADDISGSATEAGVVPFIDFMMWNTPEFQTPMRGGLAWLSNYAFQKFGKDFMDCTPIEQTSVLEDIADPKTTVPELKHGAEFFSTFRNLTATGFFSSKMGIEDLDYKGNIANFWDGVPDEVLKKHGMSYDDGVQYITVDGRDKLAKWDDDKNLI